MALFGRNKDKKGQDGPGVVDKLLARIGADFADDSYEEDSAPHTRAARNNRTASTGEYLVGDRVAVSWNRFSPEQLVTISIYAKDDDLLRRVVEENAKEDVMVTGANIDGFNRCLMEAVLFNQAFLPLSVFEEAARAGKASSKSAERTVVFADVDGNPTTQEAPQAIADEFIDKMQYIREMKPDEFQQIDDRTLMPAKKRMSQKYGKSDPSKKSDKDESTGELSQVGKFLINYSDFWQAVLDVARNEQFCKYDAQQIILKMMKMLNQVGGYDFWQTTKPEWDALMKRATDAEAKTKELEEERDKLKDRVKHQGEKIESLTKELEEAKKGGSSGEPDPKPAEPDPKPKPAGGFAVAKTFIEMLEKKHGVKPENLPQRLRDADPEEKIPVAELLQLQKDAVAAQQAADDAAAHVVDDVDELADLLAKYGI